MKIAIKLIALGLTVDKNGIEISERKQLNIRTLNRELVISVLKYYRLDTVYIQLAFYFSIP